MNSSYQFITRNDKEKLYWFKTDDNIEYCITFSPDKRNLDLDKSIHKSIYSITLSTEEESDKTDFKIRNTVSKIFSDFFDKFNVCIYYITATYDGRQAARARKFKTWQRIFSGEKFMIINDTFEIKKTKTLIFSSIIFPERYPYKEQVDKAIQKKMQEYYSMREE